MSSKSVESLFLGLVKALKTFKVSSADSIGTLIGSSSSLSESSSSNESSVALASEESSFVAILPTRVPFFASSSFTSSTVSSTLILILRVFSVFLKVAA